MMAIQSDRPIAVDISDFSSPLDLLFHLIEKNKIDIYDIPITQITEQYLDYLDKMEALDLEIASEFLVMAATLLQIKSRMLLPQKERQDQDKAIDPREELVLRLLEYRRCKAIAGRLKEQHENYMKCMFRLPETPVRLGLPTSLPARDLNWGEFRLACEKLSRQNQLRFNDLSGRIIHILQREKISLKEKMRFIWRSVTRRIRIYFNELFPAGRSSRIEKVTGFLALLELLRLNKIKASQNKPFDVILLESEPFAPIDDDASLDRFLTEMPLEEKEYD